jgi:hypothetical protein
MHFSQIRKDRDSLCRFGEDGLHQSISNNFFEKGGLANPVPRAAAAGGF